MEKTNFIFWGSPDVASQTLNILKNNGYIPSLIITNPDKPSGRGLEITETPVSIWAKENNINCLKPEKIDENFIDNIINFKNSLNIVVAYGKILPEKIINAPKLGTINIHYSLLPKYRGASPLESFLLSGEKITGVSIQKMIFKLDSGPIIAQKEISIDLNEKKDEVKNKLINIGADLLCSIMPKIINHDIKLECQDESKATYTQKITKQNGQININGDDKENYNKYRAYDGWPGVYFWAEKNGKKIRVKIKEAFYEKEKFIITKVIPEGKKEIFFQDFIKQINTLK